MGLLGDFLETFYGGGNGFRSVHATVRRIVNEPSRTSKSRRPPIGRVKPRSQQPLTIESELWLAPTGMSRVDSTRVVDGESVVTVEVVRGDERKKLTADGNVEIEAIPKRRRDAQALPTEIGRHFGRQLIRNFFAALELTDQGTCRVAGRDCVRIRAVPIPGEQIWPHWLPANAEEFVFAADLEFPSLLSITGVSDGETVETIEVLSVEFDREIREDRFDCQPAPGGAEQAAEPVTRSVSLESAIAKAPFTVLLPTIQPAEENPHIHYEPGSRRSPGEKLVVMYIGRDSGSFWFHLCSEPDPKLDEDLEWEVAEFSGRRFTVSDPETEGGTVVVRFQQEGTWVAVYSDRPVREFLEIAASFAPAAHNPNHPRDAS